MNQYPKGPHLSSETIHASCVAIRSGDRLRAVLLAGRSGAGKSDLALRLVDRGARFVSDDYTLVRRVGQALVASAPARIAGRMEVRGLGVLPTEALDEAEVALLIDLDLDVPRLPDAPGQRMLAGIAIPVVALAALEASAPIKVELALGLHGLGAPA